MRSLMWTMLAVWSITLGALSLRAQETKPKPTPTVDTAPSRVPLTDAEQIRILSAQRDRLAASDQLTMTPQYRALEATPEYKAVQAVNEELNNAIRAVYTGHKLSDADWAICDGPGAAPCDTVAKGELVLARKPKAAAATPLAPAPPAADKKAGK